MMGVAWTRALLGYTVLQALTAIFGSLGVANGLLQLRIPDIGTRRYSRGTVRIQSIIDENSDPDAGPDHCNWDTFSQSGSVVSDYIQRYFEKLPDLPVRSQVTPGYLRPLLPETAPELGESLEDILADVDSHILPGITHWQHPKFFAWFPAETTPPSLIGDMLSGMFNSIAFSWEASPAATELETIVMDWLGKLVKLPEEFLSGGAGGGVIQGSASEAVLVALCAARSRAMRKLQQDNPGIHPCALMAKMTLYTSDQAHSCVRKAAMIAGLDFNLRVLAAAASSEFSLSGEQVRQAMHADIEAGLHPTFVCATIGTTSTCALDDITGIGMACLESRTGAWFHVDAAYAGSAAICPEYSYLLNGVEFADSFDFNLSKWLLVNFDASAMWVKSRADLREALSITPPFLQSNEYDGGLVSDYRDWQVPLGRRFRALKFWCVMRSFGTLRMQEHIRKHCVLADNLAALLNQRQELFEVVSKPRLGLVCFKLRGKSNESNLALKDALNGSGQTMLVHTELDTYGVVLRVAIGSIFASQNAVSELYYQIVEIAQTL
jgi:aromatic-L-amino-acid decarboxylase